MTKWHRDIKREFEPQGIKVSLTNGGHLRLELPNHRTVFTSGTPGDHRVIHKTRTKVQRALRKQT